MSYTYTHTFAKLEVSPAVVEEIRSKLHAAGYDDQIHVEDDGEVLIDMHGIALVKTNLGKGHHKKHENTKRNATRRS